MYRGIKEYLYTCIPVPGGSSFAALQRGGLCPLTYEILTQTELKRKSPKGDAIEDYYLFSIMRNFIQIKWSNNRFALFSRN